LQRLRRWLYKKFVAFTDAALRRFAMGAVITVWRERIRDISQGELETKAELSTGRISSYERGEDFPGAQALERIAQALEITVADLRNTADGIFHHLAQSLKPFERDFSYPLPTPSSDEVAESSMPEDLQRAWDRQLKAESDLARARVLLEYASRHREPTGGPRSDRV
jgi:transcriptional regulator with XRE-family HTH domain